MNNKRVYLPIGSARLLNIEIFLDDKSIYKGMVEDAPEDYKKLKYSEVELNGTQVKYFVYSELQ